METIHNPFRSKFFPSTMEHSPLIAEEKEELILYLSEDGKSQLGELSHWEWAESAAEKHLEAWAWGFRFWGRECMVRAGAACLRLQNSFWVQALSKTAGNEILEQMAAGKVARPENQLSLALNWADRPGEASLRAILAVRRAMPEAWEKGDFPVLKHEPFVWTVISGHALLEAIFLNRDAAARQLGKAVVGALQVCQLAGMSSEEAEGKVRAEIAFSLRKWMGWRYMR